MYPNNFQIANTVYFDLFSKANIHEADDMQGFRNKLTPFRAALLYEIKFKREVSQKIEKGH